jgi:hypothetical protein
MDDVSAMRGGQGFGDLDAVFERLRNRERTALQALSERLALEKLHDEVRLPAC